MKIEKMQIKNFRKFEELTIEFKPQINIIAGNNAAGKSTILEALAVGIGSFFLGIESIPSPAIKKDDIRVISRPVGSVLDRQPVLPVTVSCKGEFDSNIISWSRSLKTESGRTTYGDALQIKDISSSIQNDIRNGKHERILPVISYYGTGRLWLQRQENNSENKQTFSNRFDGYIDSLSALSNEKLLIKWFKKMTLIQAQEETLLPELSAVRKAISECYKSGNKTMSDTDVKFNLKSDELEIIYTDQDGKKQRQPFRELSDGYRNTLSLVGDIAFRMAALNPQMLGEVTAKTPGIVLIDEIDQHLHPYWQKNILNCLTRIFPKVQFIVTTHSPNVISSALGTNLILLDDTGMREESKMLSIREHAADIFDSLNNDQLMEFLRLFADDNTLARVESDMIVSGSETKRYSCFKELLHEIENDG